MKSIRYLTIKGINEYVLADYIVCNKLRILSNCHFRKIWDYRKKLDDTS